MVQIRRDESETHDSVKKRLLCFVPEFPRLSETFIEREMSALSKHVELDLVILSIKKGEGSISAGAQKAVVYKRPSITNLIVGVVVALVQPGKLLTITHLLIASHRSLVVGLFWLAKVLAYTGLIRGFSPNHIHCHFLSWPSTVVCFAADLLRVPFSVSAHARDIFVDGELVREKAKRAKFITVCNTNGWNRCRELAGRSLENKILKIFHGIDHTIFSATPRLGKPEKFTVFMGGTRLVEKKGIHYLIQASKILKDKGLDFQLILVGSGPLYDSLLLMISDLGLSNEIRILGENKGLPFDQVLEYYKISDVFVLPSVESKSGDVDGVPTVVIEAALAKLPIVTTRVGSITDLVDESCGFVVPQRNPQAIANAIIHIKHNPKDVETLTTQAYKRALEMFDIEKNSIELVRNILS